MKESRVRRLNEPDDQVTADRVPGHMDPGSEEFDLFAPEPASRRVGPVSPPTTSTPGHGR